MRKSQLYRVAVRRGRDTASLPLPLRSARARPITVRRSLHIPKTPKKSPMKMAAVVADATADVT